MRKVVLVGILALLVIAILVSLNANSLFFKFDVQSNTRAVEVPSQVSSIATVRPQRSRPEDATDNKHFFCKNIFEPADGISARFGGEACVPRNGEEADICYINGELVGPCSQMSDTEFSFGAIALHPVNMDQVTQEEKIKSTPDMGRVRIDPRKILLPSRDYAKISFPAQTFEEFEQYMFEDMNKFWEEAFAQQGVKYNWPTLEIVQAGQLNYYASFVTPEHRLYKDNPIYLPYKKLIVFPTSSLWGTILPAVDKASRVEIVTLMAHLVGLHVQHELYSFQMFHYGEERLNAYPFLYEADYLAGVYASTRILPEYNKPYKYMMRWEKRRFAYLRGFNGGFKAYMVPIEFYHHGIGN